MIGPAADAVLENPDCLRVMTELFQTFGVLIDGAAEGGVVLVTGAGVSRLATPYSNEIGVGLAAEV